MSTTLIKSAERGHANYGWLNTYYSYSFARYYNPERMGFGSLRVLNDDTIAPNHGFPPHSHRDMEIITIMLAGELTHEDSLGNTHTLKAGQIQVMSAGTGVTHSEINASQTAAAKLLQIWIIPDQSNLTPHYAETDYLPAKNTLTTLVAPAGETQANQLAIHQRAWIKSGEYSAATTENYELHPESYGLKIFVLEGQVKVDGQTAEARDALEITRTSTVTLQIAASTTFVLFEVSP